MQHCNRIIKNVQNISKKLKRKEVILLILSHQEPPQLQDQVLQVKFIQCYTKMIKAINQIINRMKEKNFFKGRKSNLYHDQLNSRKSKICVACLQQALLFE